MITMSATSPNPSPTPAAVDRESAPFTHRWSVPAHHAAMIGPGSLLEITVENVLGVPTEVFARRLPHMRAVLQRTAATSPNTPYLVFPDLTLTYVDMAASAARVARVLSEEHGIKKGDRVALAAANLPAHTVTWWAIASLGAIITELNGWWTAPELHYGIERSKPRLILADGQRRDRLASLGALSVSMPIVDLKVFDCLIGRAGPNDPSLPDTEIDEDDPLMILFTSGTTGRPKGATLSHRALVNMAMISMLLAATATPPGVTATAPARPSASLLAGPLFHVSGSVPLTVSAAFGTTVVVPPAGRWDELTHLRLTQEHGITGWSAVPTQFWRLLDHPAFDSFDTSSVVSVGGGGAVYPPELYRLIGEKLPQAQIATGYGMTETNGAGTRLMGITLDTHPASVGTPNPMCQFQIRGADGAAMPDGEVGEICIKGASVFLRYWDDPEATARVLDDERWYATGDYGRFVDNVLFLESRMRDLIIRGGENIYPIEIENRIIEHAEVADVCVVGVEHRELGQEVAAVVVRHPGSTLEAGDIRQFVAATLASFKVPIHVVFVNELPYTATGKMLKRDVEDELKTHLLKESTLR